MTDIKSQFLKYAVDSQALKFGDFTLKSGRKSPYFFNLGLVTTGKGLSILATAYAELIIDSNLDFDILFGPAYKGISLAALTAAKLSELGGGKWDNIEYAYNRKEVKDHGEGGMVVGAKMQGKRVCIIDDVISAGTATGQAAGIIAGEKGTVVGIVMALDRQETTIDSDESAVQIVKKKYNVPVVSIATLDDIISKLENVLSEKEKTAILEYRKKYVRN